MSFNTLLLLLLTERGVREMERENERETERKGEEKERGTEKERDEMVIWI